MDFEGLQSLQRRLRDLNRLQSDSLAKYFRPLVPGAGQRSVGFHHLWNANKGKPFSAASTATCVVSLTSTGAWWHELNKRRKPYWTSYTAPLLRRLCRRDPAKWQSAGLPPGNPFTVAFTLEAIKALLNGKTDVPLALREEAIQTVAAAEDLLLEALQKKPTATNPPDQFAEVGAAHVTFYPPTSFLTQLVVRALDARLAKRPKIREQVEFWCRRQIEHELTLLDAAAHTRDPLALMYAVVTFVSIIDTDAISRSDSNMVAQAIDRAFDAQIPDGSWPRSRPLHHYPKFGNAYCYEYETLAQLIQAPYLESLLIRKLDKLEVSVKALDQAANNLPDGGKAWSSGHHPHLQGAESWSTASVYHFVHSLDRLVAEAIRQETFRHVGATYSKPHESSGSETPFEPAGFLDSHFPVDGKQVSLRETVQNFFLQPILREIHQVQRGESLPKETPISAILFGPPGTSKTKLAQLIADHLGWPRLDVDPSHMFKAGLEQVQSESNRLFNMLAALERTVVFFDEFDEMVRARTSDRADLVSRFLTTAMLPKLTRIADERKIVFLLATNHIEDFDFAISRPGRFDMLLPVMPPTLEAKFANPQWKGVKARLRHVVALSDKQGLSYEKILGALTFDEFKAFYKATKTTSAVVPLKRAIDRAWAKATLNQSHTIREPDGAQETLLDFYDKQCANIARVEKKTAT